MPDYLPMVKFRVTRILNKYVMDFSLKGRDTSGDIVSLSLIVVIQAKSIHRKGNFNTQSIK